MDAQDTTARSVEATVDRIEGDSVVLDADGTELRLPRAWLTGDVHEGAGYTVTVAPAPAVEAAMKSRIAAKLAALTKAGEGRP